MNASEAAMLLGLCASYDQRTTGEADARAWAAALASVSLPDGRDAVIQYYQLKRERIMPSDVLALVRVRRDRQAAEARQVEGSHCGRSGCQCTHSGGCEYGWLDVDERTVKPCPQCRGDRLPRAYEDRKQWLGRLRGGEAAA